MTWRQFSSIHRLDHTLSIPLFWTVYMVFKLCKPNFFFGMLQDDAIRNLFSAKTFHEYSAQSLLTFLV